MYTIPQWIPHLEVKPIALSDESKDKSKAEKDSPKVKAATAETFNTKASPGRSPRMDSPRVRHIKEESAIDKYEN